MEQSVIKDYLSILKKYKDIYGQKTALLYQVGAFMEMYALQSPAGIFVENEELEKVANICNLGLVDKKQVYNNMRVFMSGNREYFCEKYLNLLSDAGYTTIVYTQHKEATGKFVRRLECVVSSGTHITYDTDSNTQHSNYILCIWIERVTLIGGGGAEFVIGISAANIFTGKTYIFEYSVPAGAQVVPSQFDELERQISTFAPSEIIFISDFDRAQLQSIIKFSNIKCSLIHYIDFENEKARNCTKQKYINHVFSTYFGDNEIFFKCTELQTHILATQSFCFLLDFIYEHNPNLLKNINLPIIQNTSTRLILGNQTLRQLNIIDDGGHRGGSSTPAKFSSVVNFLNETQTPMGRRLFQQQLVAPVFDEEWLESQYNIIDYMLSRIEFVDFFRSPGHLSNIRDLEKINRQIMIRKIYPSSIYQLHKTIRAAITLEENISINTPELLSYSSLPSTAREFAEMLETRLFLEKCKTCSSMTTFEENIFRCGAPVLHEVEEKYNAAKKELENIHAYLCGLATAPGEEEYVKIHETDKYGITLQITKRRGALLRAALARPAAAAGSQPTDPAEIKFVAATGGGGEEIISPHIREVSKNIIMYREKLNDLIVEEYKNFLENLENYYKTIDETAAHLAKIDVILTKAAVSYKNNYCRPRIAADVDAAATTTATPSYVHARGMRHVLIEHINQTETYVPNDVEIAGADGLLIYGVNTTGKTSYIRSVGISIIMAQSGMFVPCDKFTYKPYRSIFSRILGNDNLFHGLSTFAVEMSELRVILKMANPYTLVIGDEVCSGTENQSALSIFVAALVQLAARKCSFLFATHFHEILEYEEIRQMDQLKIKHMSVLYDRERDVLVYERKLRDGAGHRMYGIEICKSLHMPADFIELAYSLRNKYFQETTGALSHKQSVYNGAKMRGMCEMCGERMSEETHHIYEQKHARENGYVSGASFHKNHAGNLMAVCSVCHDKIHNGGGGCATTTPAPESGTKRKKKIIII